MDELAALWKKLSKREKLILSVTMAMVMIALSDQIIVRPVVRMFWSLQKQVQDLKSEVKKSTRLLSQKEELMKELEQYSIYTVKAGTPEEETVALLKLIEKLANISGVNLLYVKPANVKGAEEGKMYYATLETESQMPALSRFFYEIESSNNLLKIEKFTLQPASKGSSVIRCAATISKAILT